MTKHIQIIATCDRTELDTSRRVPADQTVFFAFGYDPLQIKIREIDLTDEWGKKMAEFLEPFLRASHAPNEIGSPEPRQAGHQAAAPGSETRAYYARMRAWADETGFTKSDGQPGYTTLDKGGYYHSTELRKAYAAHLHELATQAG